MTRHTDLPELLPVFPLPGALMLPRARLPLHIFEPRYLAMLDDALKSDARLIGMIQPCPKPTKSDQANLDQAKPGQEDRSRLHCIGCAGRITQFSETEDGRYMITLTGISRFRVIKEVDGFHPYRRCQVSWDGFERDQAGAEADDGFDRSGFMALLERYFDAQDLSVDWPTLTDADDELLINSLSMLLDLTPEDRQALLEAPSLCTRRETLVTLIEYALRGGEEDLMQ